MMEERTEQCAYIKLDRKQISCELCEGYSNTCFEYVTVEHLEQFKKMFDVKSSIEELLDRGF